MILLFSVGSDDGRQQVRVSNPEITAIIKILIDLMYVGDVGVFKFDALWQFGYDKAVAMVYE